MAGTGEPDVAAGAMKAHLAAAALWDMAPMARQVTPPAAKLGIGRHVVAGDAQILINAVVKGDVDWLRTLCTESGRDVNASNLHNWTPLHIAAVRGHIDVVRLLVGELKANVNLFSQEYGTPLDLAVREQHTQVAAYLVSKGALRGCQILQDAPFNDERVPVMNGSKFFGQEVVSSFGMWLSQALGADAVFTKCCGSCGPCGSTDKAAESDTRLVVTSFPVMSNY